MRRHPLCAFVLIASLIGAAAAPGCGQRPDAGSPRYTFEVEEGRYDAAYAARAIDLEGRVVGADGFPLAGAEVRLIGWGEARANDGATVTTGIPGTFRLEGLVRRSVLAQVTLPGFHPELVPIDLHRPLGQDVVATGDVTLLRSGPGRPRLVFAGDTMFGRRFLDRDEDGTPGEEGDLIRAATRAEDARAILTFLRPYLAAVDFAQVNLECPVAAEAVEEHPWKEYKFFSHPETLEGLTHAGVDAVSLGNNHVFDLLDTGVRATLRNVSEAGLGWFGAGFSASEARRNVLRVGVRGVPVLLQGFNGIRPSRFPPGGPSPWPDEYLYDAADDPVKAGSLRLSDANLDDYLNRAGPGDFPVPVFHGGFEYGEYPSGNLRARMVRAVENDAGLVVAHHSHTFYGVATVERDGVRVPVFLGLGNLVFDQEVFETFRSALAVVDLEESGPGDVRVRRIRLLPFHIEGYVPKPVTGGAAARFARHVGHISTHLPPAFDPSDPPDGLRGALVVPAGGAAAVGIPPGMYREVDAGRVEAVRTAGGDSGPVPYERVGGTDSLASVRTDRPCRVELGRELLLYGGFEDHDVDDRYHEARLWSQSAHRFPQNHRVRSGTGAFVLLRRASHEGYTATWHRNRVTFADGVDLTLAGWARGENAGRFEVLVRWYVRDQRTVIATQRVLEWVPGTYGWKRFTVDLEPPPEAGTVRVYFRQHPPAGGEGALCLDDVALVQWEVVTGDAAGGLDLETPNEWDWLRFRPHDTAATKVRATLGHRLYRRSPGSL